MSDNENLLPCPFCGGKVSIAITGDNYRHCYFITRGTGKHLCKCRVFMESEVFSSDCEPQTREKYKRDLIDAWNKRSDTSQIKYCSTCKWYAVYEGICCNGESEHRAGFRCLDDTCEKWEEQ